MHRYEELEKIYYKKKFLKFVFIFLIFLLIVFFIFFNFFYNFKKVHSNKIQSHTDKNVSKVKKNVEKHFNEKKLKYYLPDNYFINQKVSKKIKQKKTNKKLKESDKNLSVRKKVNLKEISVKNIENLITRFNQNPNYDLALMIAKMYLNKNDLNRAQLWTLKANEMDSSKPDSWILFSNILIKEKKYKKAKKILENYINSYGPNDIIEKKLRSIDEQ